MYGITDLRKDTLIDIDGIPYRVTEYSHTQMGRGGATVKVKIKNLLNGGVLDKTFKNDEKVTPASIDRAQLQYLYKNGQNLALMDMVSFEQYEVPASLDESIEKYFSEGAELNGLLYKEQVIGFDVPKSATIKVTETPDGAKGNTSSGGTKPATLETGIEVQVPMFIKVGDGVKVDTRTGQYLERAK